MWDVKHNEMLKKELKMGIWCILQLKLIFPKIDEFYNTNTVISTVFLSLKCN